MIAVSQAKETIRSSIQPLSFIKIALEDASGLVLAENIYAARDIPAFRQSAMDGYAFLFADYEESKKIEIVGEVPAGVNKTVENLPGKAVRIFTGAQVPEGADTVVMQEKVTVDKRELSIQDDQITMGSNVRPVGAEIKAGELALQAGTFLSPAAIGFLAGIGVSEVKVFPKPSVTVIVTGDELQQAGHELQPGQIYESNSFTLKAALRQLQIFNVKIISATDDIDVLRQLLENALQKSDMVLLTGGVSVGDYDFVLEATELCGVEKVFHKVKQRPGKPLYFGKKGSKVVFGLPGNPSSVLTCFYEYVIPAIEQLAMKKNLICQKQQTLGKAYTKKGSLTHFLKGKQEGDFVYPLDAQESFRLSSFANADCLICLPEDKEEYKEGDLVEVHILPA